MKICIYGGGNLGHVMAGYLAAKREHEITMLTNRPEKWSKIIQVTDLYGKVFQGALALVTSSPAEALPDADIVLMCLPGFAFHDELLKIRDFISPQTKVGTVVSSSGFFFEAFDILPDNITLFGFQRVPFIARTTEYGKSAELKGYKKELNVAIERCSEEEKNALREILSILFKTPVNLLHSFYEAALTNSNPLLHPARLYSLWKDWTPEITYSHNPFFYEEWTDEASEFLIAMDGEFQELLGHLPVREGSIPPILEYYESNDAQSLTNKLRSIPAFAGISSPMIKLPDNQGYIPDFNSRYFTEEILCGMRYIVEVAKTKGIKMPLICEIYSWGVSCISKYYQDIGRLKI